MSAAAPPRRRRRALIATAAASALVVGAVVWTLGPGGPLLVSQLAQGRAVWRLGTLQLEGVSGTALGDLVAARATLSDARGVWAEARDIRLGWSPLRILTGKVVIEDASATQLHIFRRPQLTAPRPPGRTIAVDLSALRIARLAIDEAVFGEAATFRFDGGLTARGAHVSRAGLIAARLDAPGDTLTLDLTRNGALTLDAALASPAGGFFSEALGAHEAVVVEMEADGNDTMGDGRLDAKVGEAALANGAFAWTRAGWSGQADLDLAAAPALAELSEALGERLRVEGRGAREGERAFVATLNAAHAQIESRGRLGRNWRPDGALQVSARTDRLREFVPGVSRGAARFEGTLSTADGASVADGRLTGDRVGLDSVAATFSGPLRVRLSRNAAKIDAEVGLRAVEGLEALSRLARNGRFFLDAEYDRTTSRLSVARARLSSPNAEVTAAGTLGDGGRGLSGRWRIAQLSEADRRIGGVADGTFTYSNARVLTLEGAARSFTTTLTPLDQLLGSKPRLETRLAVGDGGVIDVQRFDVAGAQLRMGAVGRLRDGVAALTFEASGQGPLRLGAAELAGIADARGRIAGKLDAPAIEATAQMSRLDVAGLAIDKPTVTLRFAPMGGGARGGRVEVVGTVAGEPARAEASLHADGKGLAFNDLTVAAAGFMAAGNAALTPNGPSADLTFSGVVDTVAAPMRGRIAGVARLTPARTGEPVLDLDAHLQQGRVGNLVFSRLDAAAAGPVNNLRLRAGVHGAAAGAPVVLDAEGSLVRSGGATALRLEARGAVAGSSVTTRGPIEVRVAGESVGARGAVTLDDGAATFDYSETRSRTSLSADLANAPIAPIFAFIGERATGRAKGTLRASGDTNSIEGAIDMTIADALFARRARDPVTLVLNGKLSGGTATLQATATSRNGLDAAIDGRAPVSARAAPLRIALAGEGRATWRAKGPADALWGIVGSLDQQVAGDIDGAGDIRFAAGRLSGDGALTLANGRFADKQSGIDLRDVSARVSFANDAARLEQFSARDANGGTLTGTGRADGLRNGEIALDARNIRLLGRPDARAVASGPLRLRWTGDGATLTGDLTLTEATLAPPRAGANIPVLDVVEINRPASLDIEPERRSALRATLDLRVRAPGRVFLRGRGLDSEWAVDLTVRGNANAPRVFGTAELVRGRFTLAGRPFDAERGLIRFNGAPEEALIDLVAALSAPDLTARVQLTGSVSDPDIELSSTPSLPEDEILPQALFGRASEDLSALEAAQLAASLAELAGQASLNIAGAARDLVGLDRLDVRDGGTGLRIAGGKYLTRDVYLEVARTGVGETETQVEWRVRPQLFLISAFQPNGDRRLSVRWRREY